MTEKLTELADIVRTCFPARYNPHEALQHSFSNTYLPEQDHNLNFLRSVASTSVEFGERVSTFLGALQANEDARDIHLNTLLHRALQKCGYDNFPAMRRAYEEYHRREICKADEWKSTLHSRFSQVSPPSLCALWAIQHEARLDEEERIFLIQLVADWPLSDPRFNEGIRADKKRGLIYAKFQQVYPAKLSHSAGDRFQRRASAYRHNILGQDSKATMREYDALHDLDHAFTSWGDILKAKEA